MNDDAEHKDPSITVESVKKPMPFTIAQQGNIVALIRMPDW